MTDRVKDLRPPPSDLRPKPTAQSRPKTRSVWDWSESEVSDSSPDPDAGRKSTPRIDAGAAPRHNGHAWVTVAVSTTPKALRELDAAVLKIKQAGVRRMNRSWLLRIALERLDVEQVITDLVRVSR